MTPNPASNGSITEREFDATVKRIDDNIAGLRTDLSNYAKRQDEMYSYYLQKKFEDKTKSRLYHAITGVAGLIAGFLAFGR